MNVDTGMTPRTIVLLRHAKAGDRDAWRGDDALRPLTKPGKRQAAALVEQLAGLAVTRVLSSRYRRCQETVRPLADRLGLAVEVGDALQEGSSLESVLALMAALDGNAVLCSHGDVIGAILEYLVAEGTLCPPLAPTEKGAYWLIACAGRRYTSARLLPAP